ncbi:UvrD-helicase domain-containing protein [Aliivibrio wodanis]|uniref:UvrD-helicase domain-containing protein n=1 Tax=Aliivibrio wodanis TaxID=80852 RepID=UPI00406CD764
MGLTFEDPAKLEQEETCQKSINTAIDYSKDFIFEAGAGSGKTYALKESLKYILKTKSKILKNNRQKILCITYTNSAAREIKSRIGSTELVVTSTIHDALWGLIGSQQRALRKIHSNKIRKEILKIEESFTKDSSTYSWFMSQNDINKRALFISYIISIEFINKFYDDNIDKKSFKDDVESFGYIFNRNMGKFKKTASSILNISKLQRAETKLNSSDKVKIHYDAMRNNDSLHRMKFSHDTLLEYSLAICTEYPTMFDIIIDKYPYIFIDEFQDTNPLVVELFNELSLRSNIRSRKVCIGYFGDVIQGIYRDGICNDIFDVHQNLTRIIKKYNRRSYEEIINVFDKFRNDDLSQESIYKDCSGGTFKYYTSKLDSDIETSVFIELFMKEIKSRFTKSDNDELCCLVLKNATIAELSGFKELYESLKRPYYYNEQAKLIINNDINKLDGSVRVIYDILELINQANIHNAPFRELLPSSYGNVTLKKATEHINELRTLIPDYKTNFSIAINELLDNYDSYSDLLKKKIDSVFSICDNDYSLETFTRNLSIQLSESTYKDIDITTKIIKESLEIKTEQFFNWFNYLQSSNKKSDVFLTCHNSKGLEYDNVVVFLDDKFNNKNDYISAFFDDPTNEVFQERRNLLYVSLSRAIKNLVVCFLYRDDKPSEQAECFFGKATEWVHSK